MHKKGLTLRKSFQVIPIYSGEYQAASKFSLTLSQFTTFQKAAI